MSPLARHIELTSQALARIPMFSRLEEDDLAGLAATLQIEEFGANQVLMEEGTSGSCAYVILEGTVKVSRGGIAVTSRGPGACLGELSLLDDAPRSASVAADGHVVAVRIDRADFERLLSQPDQARSMLLGLSSKIREGVDTQVETSKAAIFLREAFSRYVSEDVLTEIINAKDPEALLSGRLATATILFSDIRHFTTLSEQLSPNELVKLLRTYLGRMIDVVTHSKGFINKFIGDALLVLFGLPLPQEHAEVNAASAALDMLAAVEEINVPRRAEGLQLLEIGIGIHTGEVVAGNIGDMRRMEYTVIGDNVNLCSRLEGLTKTYGVPIVLSQGIKSHLEGKFEVRPLDVVRVKGKKSPTAIFELCGRKETVSPRRVEFNLEFSTALNLYLSSRFEEARAALEALPESLTDGPTRLLMDRCAAYQKQPPPEDWDGVFEMASK